MEIKRLACEIAREEGVEALLFSEFMSRRFPQETDGSYVRSWARRFKTGDPVGYMDSQSKEVYNNPITVGK